MALVINKDGSITRDGKTYKNRAEYSAAMKKKRAEDKKSSKPKWWEGRKAKEKRAEKESIAQGKRNQAATKKMYAAESMFKTAKARDDAKVKPGKARSFKEAFDAATKAGKDRFTLKGKSYLTTKGKRADRFPVTTDKKKPADKKLNIFQKFTKKMRGTNPDGSIRTQAEFEAARDKRKLEKRITKIKERKNQGKSYSAKNLKELEAKLSS